MRTVGIVVAALGLALGLLLYWGSSRWDDALERTLKGLVAPAIESAGLTLEEFRLETSWRAALSGRAEQLTVVIKRGTYRLRARGPIEVIRKNGLSLKYDPDARLNDSSTVALHFEIALPKNLNLPAFAELTLPETAWSIPSMGLSAERLSAHILWDTYADDAPLAGSIRVKGLHMKSPPHEIALSELTLGLRGTLDAAAEGANRNFALKAPLKIGMLEWLEGDTYRDPDFSNLPLELSWASEKSDTLSLHAEGLRLNLNPKTWELGTNPGTSAPLDPLWKKGEPLARAFGVNLPAIHSLSGRLSGLARGTVSPKVVLSVFDFKLLNGGMEWGDTRVRGLTLNARGTETNVSAKLSIQAIEYKKFRATLGTTSLEKKSNTLTIGRVGTPIPLALVSSRTNQRPARFELGPIQGQWKSTAGSGSDFELSTSLWVDRLPLPLIKENLCLNAPTPPPGTLSIHWPQILIYPMGIEPSGEVIADFLGGRLQLEDLAVFRWQTETPEFRGSAELKNIKLSHFGDWAQFGEMDGLLDGYAHDVVIQGWLPTQFDFKLAVRGDKRRKVVFSPTAMKNVIRLVAGEDLGHVPGIAQWFAFGWPSRVFGGYDVDYAGVSIFSAEGRILLETLDPPDSSGREQKNYILYGPRFKMPLQAKRYPVLVDASAMGNFARRFVKQLEELAEGESHGTAFKSPAPPNLACRPDP